jgi:hypothetical protein
MFVFCMDQRAMMSILLYMSNMAGVLEEAFRLDPCWEDFQKSANQKQELPMVAMFDNGSEQNEQSLEDLP